MAIAAEQLDRLRTVLTWWTQDFAGSATIRQKAHEMIGVVDMEAVNARAQRQFVKSDDRAMDADNALDTTAIIRKQADEIIHLRAKIAADAEHFAAVSAADAEEFARQEKAIAHLQEKVEWFNIELARNSIAAAAGRDSAKQHQLRRAKPSVSMNAAAKRKRARRAR